MGADAAAEYGVGRERAHGPAEDPGGLGDTERGYGLCGEFGNPECCESAEVCLSLTNHPPPCFFLSLRAGERVLWRGL